jgi:Glycosidases
MKKNKKIIIYQVFTRLFGNDKSANIQNGNKEENGVGKLSAFSDKALTEIKKMGVTHIWYTGLIEHATQTDYSAYGIRKDHPAIVKGIAGSPYAIKDYYDIDPDLAEEVPNRMKEFEALVERTHRAGLKMIIDFVPNHVARQYHSDSKPEGTPDLGENDDIHTTFSVNNNFYYIPGQAFNPTFNLTVNGETYTEDPAKVTGNNRFDANPSKNDWYETVKLNYGIDFLGGNSCHFDPVPDTWNKMLQILRFWGSKKIDAFRCDMAEMVPVDFWGWAIPQLKEEYNVDFIAEIYNPDQYRNYIQNGKFDYLYDKVGLYDTLRAIVSEMQNAASITSCWQSVEGIQHRMLNFLENHDEQRIASDFFAGDPQKAIPAMIAAATMGTNPVMIYFGQELGERGMDEEGFSGRDGRTSIFDYWSPETIRNWRNQGKYNETKLSDAQKKLRKTYRNLLTLCNKEKAITDGIFYDLMYTNYENPQMDTDKQYAYFRYCENELLLIILNFGSQEALSGVYLPAHFFDFIQIEPENIKEGKELFLEEKAEYKLNKDALFNIYLPPYTGRIIKFAVNK